MNRRNFWVVSTAALLAACGGGSGSGSNSDNATLSEDQKIYEKVSLAPDAQYRITGASIFSAGGGFLAVTATSLSKSPLTGGAQTVVSTLEKLPADVSLPASLGVLRYLVNGKIVVSSAPVFKSVISYQGTSILNDTLSADGSVVVARELRSGYSHVPLTGLVTEAPAEFKQYLGSPLTAVGALDPAAKWPADAGYVKFTSKFVGDTYYVYDYTTITTDANVSPVSVGATLEEMLKVGINMASDGKNYLAADGTISTVNGVKMFIAKEPRPRVTTTMYRTFFELGGKVYTGAYLPDGTLQGGSVRLENGMPVYDSKTVIRFNRAAFNGLKAAIDL